MPSVLTGFEYDIFISYRQKDNKQDGWVTQFVHDLKGELESTFKEEIGVYFDVNPHDGLLETHDVGASLKEKLKCLIFIPVISRTYCDPKSFAWEHEFKAFIEQASKDMTGAFLLAAMAAGVLLYPKIFNGDKYKNLKDADGRISFAVMPFKNLTNDTIWNVWEEGIQNEIISDLSNYKELRVKQIESITGALQTRNPANNGTFTPSFAIAVSKKPGANLVLFGSIKEAGKKRWPGVISKLPASPNPG